MDTTSMFSTKHTPVGHHLISYVLLLNLKPLRPKFPCQTRNYCAGIGGAKGAVDADIRGRQLFSTIVQNTATTTGKRLMVSSAFVNMKTRGKAVSIGPLEYCGNGIPLNTTHNKVM